MAAFVVSNTCLLVSTFLLQPKSSHLETALVDWEDGNTLLPWPTRIKVERKEDVVQWTQKTVRTQRTKRTRSTVRTLKSVWTRSTVRTWRTERTRSTVRTRRTERTRSTVRTRTERTRSTVRTRKSVWTRSTKRTPKTVRTRRTVFASALLPVFLCRCFIVQVWENTLTFTEKSLLTAWKRPSLQYIIWAIMVFMPW
jgi:hypothetical protein